MSLYSNSFFAFSSIIQKDEPQKSFYQKFILPTCYKMFCRERTLTIKINEKYIICSREGGYINIGNNYTGYLFCTDYNLICTQTDQRTPCNNKFDCADNEITMEEDYIYDYIPVNVSVQIKEIEEISIYFLKGYKES